MNRRFTAGESDLEGDHRKNGLSSITLRGMRWRIWLAFSSLLNHINEKQQLVHSRKAGREEMALKLKQCHCKQATISLLFPLEVWKLTQQICSWLWSHRVCQIPVSEDPFTWLKSKGNMRSHCHLTVKKLRLRRVQRHSQGHMIRWKPGRILCLWCSIQCSNLA